MAVYKDEVLASKPEEPASTAVVPPSSADQATATNDAAFDAGKKKMEKDYEEKTTPSATSKVQFGEFQTEIPTFFTTAPGMVTGLAAAYGAGVGLKKGAEAGATGLKKVYDSLRDFHKDKFGDDGLLANQQAEKAASQELAAATPQEASAKVSPPANVDANANVGKQLNPTDTQLLNKSIAIPENKTVAKDLAATEKTMAQGVEKGLPPPTLTTGTGKPAYAGQADTTKFKSSYATPEAVPKGYAFVPNAQYIDPLRVNLGQETYTNEFKARDFPTTYKGSPTSAIEVSNEINRGLNRPTRAQLIEQGAKLPENVKGITKEVSKSKLVKVAGVGGALIALSDLANAKEAARNVGEALLPWGATPTPVESGKIPSLERKELSEQYVINQPGNRAELEAKIKGKTADEANKIRQEYLASAPMTDFERASRVFRQQASAKQGIAPPSMR